MALLQRRDRKLTDAEKEFARRFRDAAQSQLTAKIHTDPPTYTPPMFLAIFRHKCSSRPHNESTAIELKEVYVSSVDAIGGEWFGHEVEASHFKELYPDHVNGLGETEGLPLFGFFYKEGECRKCKDTAVSPAGKLVLQSERPPVAGRMARA
jgi:hypothetical protein